MALGEALVASARTRSSKLRRSTRVANQSTQLNWAFKLLESILKSWQLVQLSSTGVVVSNRQPIKYVLLGFARRTGLFEPIGRSTATITSSWHRADAGRST